jgi:hypothetical protein
MFRKLICAAFFGWLLCGIPGLCEASWRWVPDGTGYFLRSDGHGNHDGFRYSKSGCNYYPVAAIAVTPQYKPDWQTSIVNAAYQLKDRQAFLAALEVAGLSVEQTQPYGNASGLSVIQSGSTVQGYAAHAAQQLNPQDVIALAHEGQRLAARVADISGQTTNGTLVVAEQLVEATKIQAAGQAFSAGFQAAVTAAQPPRTEVHQWQQQSGQQANTFSASGSGDLSALLRTVGTNILQTKCAACHGAGKAHGALTTDHASEILRRIALPPDHKEFMPKGKAALSPAEQEAVKAAVQ